MAADWDSKQLWVQHMERQLYELGALVRGQVPTVSSRIADLVEQLDELRKELKEVQIRMDKMSEWAKSHHKKENGS